jgi:hypothetical protein
MGAPISVPSATPAQFLRTKEEIPGHRCRLNVTFGDVTHVTVAMKGEELEYAI